MEQAWSKENEETAEFVGNTSSNAESSRVNDSKWAIDAFLQSLPVWAGLSEEKVLFVLDGMRPHLYNENQLVSARGSYFDLMRTYFVDVATKRGYEVVDMQSIFLAHHQQHNRHFEHQHDMHWNALGHALCFEAISKTAFFTRLSVQLGAASEEQDM